MLYDPCKYNARDNQRQLGPGWQLGCDTQLSVKIEARKHFHMPDTSFMDRTIATHEHGSSLVSFYLCCTFNHNLVILSQERRT